MKRSFVFLLVLIASFGSYVFAADQPSLGFQSTLGSTGAIPSVYQGAIPLAGKTPRTTQVTLDNTARTLDNLVVTGSGTYLGGSDNTLTPIAATISCETADTQWAFTTTPTAAVGHVLTSGSSWQLSGPDALALLRGRNSADGTSATCAVTLWY